MLSDTAMHFGEGYGMLEKVVANEVDELNIYNISNVYPIKEI